MTPENLTIHYLHSAYRRGDFTPRQLVNHLVQKAQGFRKKNIFIRTLDKGELDIYLLQLDPADMETKPLWGIPFVVKDNIDLAGIPTTAGCEAFAYTPERNAHVVQCLLDAGAIPLAKTNLDQFATGLNGTRSPQIWGPCHNAFDDDYISGGSSSGSAVAVSLGLASFSLGSDTAGSGRVPAAFNNLLGLKPSLGLLSCKGVVPACRTLDCVSIFATTADDLERVFEAGARFDNNDAYARRNPAHNHTRGGTYQSRFRFAVPEASQLQFFGDTEAEKLFENAVQRLESLGGEKCVRDFSPLFDAARLLYAGPWVAERYLAAKELYDTQPETLLPVIRDILGSQLQTTAADTFSAFYQLLEYKRQAELNLSGVDFFVTPTAPTCYRIEQMLSDPINLNSNLGYYTNFMNLLDFSAISLPADWYENGLPFGITLAANAFQDASLLALARRWQSQLDFPLGATGWPLPASKEHAFQVADPIEVVVCGAHLEGLPLNWQLQERSAILSQTTTTASAYRFYALPGGPPFRPGLVRDESNGSAIEVEVWKLPVAEFGSFVAGIPAPLGIGKVELADGRWVSGFICEPCGIEGAEDITHLGSWRSYISEISAGK